MNPGSTLNRSDPGAAIPPQFVLTLGIIHLALASGILLFGAVTLFLLFRSDPSVPSRDPEVIHTLSVVHLALAGASLAGAWVVFGKLIERAAGTADSAASLWNGLRTAYIVRLAILEGVAIFGLVICLLMNHSLLREQPVYWLNLVSPIGFLLFIAITFPTKARLEDLLRERRSELR